MLLCSRPKSLFKTGLGLLLTLSTAILTVAAAAGAIAGCQYFGIRTELYQVSWILLCVVVAVTSLGLALGTLHLNFIEIEVDWKIYNKVAPLAKLQQEAYDTTGLSQSSK